MESFKSQFKILKETNPFGTNKFANIETPMGCD